MKQLSKALDSVGEKNPKVAKYLAAFSALLSRVAHADGDISDEEVELMRAIVRSRSGLDGTHAELVVDLAKSTRLEIGGQENVEVARIFQSVASEQERHELIDCLFAVASADQVIYPSEMKSIRDIARQVGLKKADVELIASGYEQYLQS